MGGLEEFKCPCCGGTLAFNPSDQKVQCAYCGTEYDVEKIKEARADSGESMSDQTEWAQAGQEWGMGETDNLNLYCCESCGGELIADDNTAATSCPYCGNAVVIKGRVSGTLRPDKVIPFQKTKEDSLNALADYVASKRLVLRSFKDRKTVEEIKGMYVPFWVFDADVYAHLTYLCTTTEHIHHGNDETIITRYYDVARAGDVAYDHIPADGSKKMDDQIMESIEPFDYNKAVDFDTAYLSGYLADKYDVSQEEMKPRMTERVGRSVDDEFRKTLFGYDTVKQKSRKMQFKKTNVDYALYPVWMLNTKYEDKTYTFAMNGQTGKVVGNMPLDKKLYMIYFLAIAIILGSVMFGAVSGILGKMSMMSGGIGYSIGIVISFIIVEIMRRNLKAIKFQKNASMYYRPGSFHLRYDRDTYLYQTRRTIHHKND